MYWSNTAIPMNRRSMPGRPSTFGRPDEGGSFSNPYSTLWGQDNFALSSGLGLIGALLPQLLQAFFMQQIGAMLAELLAGGGGRNGGGGALPSGGRQVGGRMPAPNFNQSRSVPGGWNAANGNMTGASGPAAANGNEAPVGNNLTDFVKHFEGFDPNAYWDHGQWSIGYGTHAKPGETVSKAEGARRLTSELNEARSAVIATANQGGYSFNENQLDALTSFHHNTGRIKELLINNGHRSNDQVASKMREYNKASGKVLRGLQRRRDAESALFQNGFGGGSDKIDDTGGTTDPTYARGDGSKAGSNVPFITQYDGRVPGAGDTACYRASRTMMDAAGVKIGASTTNRIQVATGEDGNGKVQTSTAAASRGRDYIDAQLARGRPVTVGVSHKGGYGGNRDGITDHYVVIKGKGTDAQGRAFYEFHDPSSVRGANGKFYVDQASQNLVHDGSIASGKVVDRRFTLSMVIRNENAA